MSKGIISVICGALAFLGGYIPYVQYLTPVFAIAALVLGILALKDSQEEHRTCAKWGIALGVIYLLVLTFAIVLILAFWDVVQEIIKELGSAALESQIAAFII